MTDWGEITVECKTRQDGRTTARITQADKHCLVHPNLIQAIREQQFDWARIVDDLLTFDDGETRVVYRIGGNVMDGWNSGIRVDRQEGEPQQEERTRLTPAEYVARARKQMLDAGEDPDRPVFACEPDDPQVSR